MTVLSRKRPRGRTRPAVRRRRRYEISEEMLAPMLGNWTLTATGAVSPVGEWAGARTAAWTWPREAAAKGTGSNDAKRDDQFGPREVFKTPLKIKLREWKKG